MQSKPASVAVLRFLGEALEVSAEVRDGAILVDGSPVPVEAAGRRDGPIRLFVRPWHFERAAPGEANINGIVRNVYRAQGRAHVAIERPGQEPFTINLAEASSPHIDQSINLKIRGGHLFLRGHWLAHPGSAKSVA